MWQVINNLYVYSNHQNEKILKYHVIQHGIEPSKIGLFQNSGAIFRANSNPIFLKMIFSLNQSWKASFSKNTFNLCGLIPYCVVSYQLLHWWYSLGCKNLLKSTCNTKNFLNRHLTIKYVLFYLALRWSLQG